MIPRSHHRDVWAGVWGWQMAGGVPLFLEQQEATCRANPKHRRVVKLKVTAHPAVVYKWIIPLSQRCGHCHFYICDNKITRIPQPWQQNDIPFQLATATVDKSKRWRHFRIRYWTPSCINHRSRVSLRPSVLDIFCLLVSSVKEING